MATRGKFTGECAVDGCLKGIYSWKADPNGLCRHHHGLLKRFGTVNATYEDMFNERIDKSAGPDKCWIWTGGTNGNGYGVYFTISDAIPEAPSYVHRIAYWFAHGPIPEGMEIDHRCHVLLCVNPKHLRETTIKQNRENRKGADSDSRIGIRGVTAWKENRFKAQVVHNKRTIHCGIFDTAEEAGRAALAKRLELFTHNDVDRRAAS